MSMSNSPITAQQDTTADPPAEPVGEATLPDIEAMFRIVADVTPALMWMADAEIRVTFFNKAVLEFTGRSMDQELGHGWTDGIHAEDVQHCSDLLAESFAARKPFAMEYRHKHADGEYRWVISTGLPRYGAHGTFLGYFGSSIDINERKRAETDRAHAEAKLHEAQSELARVARLTTMGELGASIAHEVNQPLAAVVTFGHSALRWLDRASPEPRGGD